MNVCYASNSVMSAAAKVNADAWCDVSLCQQHAIALDHHVAAFVKWRSMLGSALRSVNSWYPALRFHEILPNVAFSKVKEDSSGGLGGRGRHYLMGQKASACLIVVTFEKRVKALWSFFRKNLRLPVATRLKCFETSVVFFGKKLSHAQKIKRFRVLKKGRFFPSQI